MAYIEYDYKKNVIFNRLPVKSVYKIFEDISEQYVLGDIDDSEYWQIETHIKGQISRNGKQKRQFLRFAIWDEDDALDKVSVDNGAGYLEEMIYFKDEKIYFIPNRFTDEKKISDIPNPVTGAGVQQITIQYKNGNVKKKKLIILPSISTEYYTEMIRDLTSIHQKLAEDTESGLSIEMYWGSLYKKYSALVEELDKYFKLISKNPKTTLGKESSKKNIYHLKHADMRAILRGINSGKEYVPALEYGESFDIYEHRVIKKYIINLIKLLKSYEEFEKDQYIAFLNEVKDSKFLFNDPDSIYKKNEEFINSMLNKDYSVFVKEKEKVRNEIEGRASKTCLTVNVTGEILYSYDVKDKAICIHSAADKDDKYNSRPFQADLTQYKTKLISLVSLELKEFSRYQLAFFIYYIDYINNNEFRGRVSITGYVIKPTEYYSRNSSYPTREFCYEWITEIRIGNIIYSFDDFCSNNDIREQVFNSNLIRMLKEDSYDDDQFFKLASFKRNELVEQRKNYAANLNDWGCLREKAANWLAAYDFLKIKCGNEKLFITNIFRRESNYRNVYRLLSKEVLGGTLENIGFWGDVGLSIGKSEHIYEYWCYIKILDIFINTYGFRIVDKKYSTVIYEDSNKMLRKSIADFLREGKIEGTGFVLYLESFGLWASIEFNKKILLPYEIKRGKAVELTPDYYIAFFTRDSGPYNFCLDAKYKSFERQEKQMENEEYSEWFSNLFNVAAFKYIRRIQEGTREEHEIAGSFIIHSDIKSYSNSTVKWDYKQYYGGINGFLLKKYKKDKVPDEDIDFVDEDLQYKIGSVALLPGREFYIKNLFRMIMEHIIGKAFSEEKRWRSKCWICGSDDISYKQKLTETDHFKFHIVCNSCKQFWVQSHCINWKQLNCHTKFAKHPENYFEHEDDKWNVYCPNCNCDVKKKKAWYKLGLRQMDLAEQIDPAPFE